MPRERPLFPDFVPEDKQHLYPGMGHGGKFQDFVPGEDTPPLPPSERDLRDLERQEQELAKIQAQEAELRREINAEKSRLRLEKVRPKRHAAEHNEGE